MIPTFQKIWPCTAISLLAILPNALETGYSEIISLKVRVQSNQPRVGLR